MTLALASCGGGAQMLDGALGVCIPWEALEDVEFTLAWFEGVAMVNVGA